MWRRLQRKLRWWLIHTFTRPTIFYSFDGALYYVTATGCEKPGEWYSVKVYRERFETGPFDSGVEIETYTGRRYCRKVLPFTLWNVAARALAYDLGCDPDNPEMSGLYEIPSGRQDGRKVGHREKARWDDDLVLDYCFLR